jgi:hypothetical protein
MGTLINLAIVFLGLKPEVVKIKSNRRSAPRRVEETVFFLANSRGPVPEADDDPPAGEAGLDRQDIPGDQTPGGQEREQVEKQLSAGANWFYWIAGLSMITSIMTVSGSDWGFVIALAITQIIDSLARELGVVGIAISLIFDAIVAGAFVVFGVFANKGHKWAFITGMILYSLDTLLILAAQIWLALLFHIVALYCIFKGFQACRKIGQIPIAAEGPQQ